MLKQLNNYNIPLHNSFKFIRLSFVFKWDIIVFLFVLHSRSAELEEPLSLLAAVALAPPRGDHAPCSCDCEACRGMERSLHAVELQLQFLMSKADDLQDCLVSG